MSERLGRLALMLAPYVVLTVAGCALLVLWRPVAVAGGSMRPALAPGDLVLVRRDATPHEGDIALVEPRSGPRYLHRVVGVECGGDLIMKGDANAVADHTVVPVATVSGVVRAVVPVGAWIAVLRRSM